MAAHFPTTSVNLLSKLRRGDSALIWEVSWKRFLELYHEPLEVVARSCYRLHTGGQEPGRGFIEDAVADVVANFFAKGQHRYDADRGRLRTYLRVLRTPVLLFHVGCPFFSIAMPPPYSHEYA